ncbi:MAG TPA: anthranilate synthase component I [Patescibacteria group bacterium]|nr:anthranilate synthase component I [Patescibacteria group bacterium]
MSITPDFSEFSRLAEKYNLIPLTLNLATDTETPVSLYQKLVGDSTGFMLESAESGKNFGRYSFIGAQPFALFTARGRGVEITIDGETVLEKGAPLEVLRTVIARFQAAPVSELPLASGGAVGYFAYDLIGTFERVRGHRIPEDLLLCQMLFCQVLVIMDHLTHTSRLVVLARIQPGQPLEQAYQNATALLQATKNRLETVAIPANGLEMAQNHRERIRYNVTKEEFMARVKKAQEHIRAGDIFQVVPSQPFNIELDCSPFTLYRRLRRVNPSPYMFYLNFGARQIVGASPEMLVKLDKGKVYTRPIAGTRPRGKDTAEDELLAAELLADEKERAEHTMLVDLGRNDLGRVSVPGTVQVEKYMQVENFSHVMHIISDVSGSIRPDVDAIDALQACFPAGTVSGAPKVRAMEIIQDLEQRNRGIYAGAVGYLDFNGTMDTCIAIRTMVVDGQEATVQAGGGVVYDSDPEREYYETMHKAEALLKVVAGGGEA